MFKITFLSRGLKKQTGKLSLYHLDILVAVRIVYLKLSVVTEGEILNFFPTGDSQ